jgi:hypothetical protein
VSLKVYYVITELWPEWADLTEGAVQESDAVEKYMLPIARKKWDVLNWRDSETKLTDESWNEYYAPRVWPKVKEVLTNVCSN